MTVFYLIAGLVLLIGGAELLVRGASRMASALGITPLVVGLTVVAFGTSSPEFAVSIKGVLSGQGSVAVGNIIGSNIFNTLFILGLSAVITPLVVDRKLIRMDVPIMIGVSVLVWLWGWNGVVGRLEAGVLFVGLLAYIGVLIIQSRRESVEVQKEYEREFREKDLNVAGWSKNIGLTVGGLALLVVGSNWLVDSAVSIAEYFEISQLVVGLTIIAAGTSLPEVVTSVIASLRGERDIAVGNVVGSNLFNIMGVLGLMGIVAPNGVEISPEVFQFDLPVMILVSLVCLPVFFTGTMIGRWEGALLLGYYGLYMTYLIFTATEHAALGFFNAVVIYGAIPLTLIIMAISVVRSFKRKGPI